MNLNFGGGDGSGASRDPGLTPAEMRHASTGCLIGPSQGALNGTIFVGTFHYSPNKVYYGLLMDPVP